MMEKDCPKCGYGIMERVVKLDIQGGWEEGEELHTTQKQITVWRCIDCLWEQEFGNGEPADDDER